MKTYDERLRSIEKGVYATRLADLRRRSQEASPEEIFLLLEPEKIERAAEVQFSKPAYWLEFLRNGLILLPLLLTWLSLGLAALAYVQSYPAHPDQPFLKQWADGFPGVAVPVPSFIAVAIIDALLIFILFSLTLAAQFIESSARRKSAQLRSWLNGEVYKLAAASLVKSLGTGPENKRPAWAVEVHSAISHLNSALIGVESLVQSSQETLKDLVNSSQVTFENLIRASQEKLEGSVRQFGGALRDQREAVESFMQGTTKVQRAVDEMEQIYLEGKNIYLGLNETLPKVEGAFQKMAIRQDEATSALRSVSSNTSQATGAVRAIAEQFTQADLVQSTYQAASSMLQTAQIMQDTAQAMQGIANQMRNTVNKQMEMQVSLVEWASRMPSRSTPPSSKFKRLVSLLFH